MNIGLFFSWFVAMFIFMFATCNFKGDRYDLQSDAFVIAQFSFVLAFLGFMANAPLTLSFGLYIMLLLAAVMVGLYHMKQEDWWRAPVPLLLVLLVYTVTSTGMFRAEAMGNLIAPKEIDAPLFTQVEDPELRLVPKEIAFNKQSKAVNGRLPDGSIIGSMFSLDFRSSIIQVINGEKYYVTPLTWSGFWKWALNDYDVIGYVISSATESNAESKLITKNPDGSDIQIKLTKGGFFGSNLERHIYSKFGNVLTSNSYFVLDDNMYPYYVTYKIKPEVGFDNYLPDGAFITDPQTKEVTYYAQEDIPDFVDTNASEWVLLDNIDKWGSLREGFVESLGSKIELSATEFNGEKDLFFIDAANTKNGTAFFTGMENPKSAGKSLSAMLFVDSKTLETYIYYPTKEAQSETAVLDSVRSALGNLSDKWSPTQPIPYRIFGEEDVWLTPIVTQGGTSRKVEAYAYTKVFSTEKSVWDKKLSNATTRLLTVSSESGQISNEESLEPVSGSLRTIYFVNDNAYLTLDSQTKVIECNHQSVIECRGVKVGQWLDFKAMKKSDKEFVLLSFTKNPLEQ